MRFSSDSYGLQILRWVITGGLIAALLVLVDVSEAARIILQIDPTFLALAVGVGLADRAFMITKWYPLLRIQVHEVPWWIAVRAYLAATFAGMFRPSSVGSDVVRTIALGRERNAIAEVGASVAAERLLGFVALGGLCCVSLWLSARSQVDITFLVPWAAMAIVAAGLIVLVPYSRRFRALARQFARGGPIRNQLAHIWRRLFAAVDKYENEKRLLGLLTLASALEQLMPVIVLWLIALGLDSTVTLWMLVISVPLTLFVSRIPISIWSLGVTEGALIYLLSLFGISASEALAVALGGRAVELAATLPGAFFWMDLVKSPAQDSIRVDK